MLKKMWNQNRQPRPPTVDGIKIFDNGDQAANITVVCHYKLEVKINFEFKKGVGIAIKSKETSS